MRIRLLATLAVASVVLTGCGSNESEPGETAAAETQAAATGSLDSVTIEGKVGEKAKVSFTAPISIADGETKVVSTGKGEKAADGKQVTAHYTLVSGNTGEVVESTYDSGTPSGFPMDTSQISQALYDAMIDKPAGSRIAMTTQGSASNGGATETLIFVWDIESVADAPKVLDRAEGKEVEVPKDLPQVTRADNGEPSISAPKGDAPKKLVVQPVIEGSGDEVKEGQTVTVQYTGWLWNDSSQSFDSSWTRGEPFSFQVGAGNVIQGWDEGLQGQKVGSQLLLVIPPEKGYGETGTGSIPPNSTLVFVVDVLAAVG